jgi:hypothetical protein
MKNSGIRHWDDETRLVAGLAAFASLIAFVIYFGRGQILLYGDAGAHINIARRVFDSRTPGLLQLGTVWLPLPHLLMMPFLISDAAWSSGAGGSIPSLVCYVFSVVGVFRLVRSGLSVQNQPKISERIAAWVAVIIFAANPNLLYLQTTALTEPVYLAFFVWSVVYFVQFAQTGNMDFQDGRALVKCGLCLAGGCLTRYDGWFLAVGMCAVAILLIWKWCGLRAVRLHPGLRKFVLIAAAAPVLWLTYNAVIYKNPLEFANGPYSAKAIEQRTTPPGSPPHPGANNLQVAASFFLKAVELNMLLSNWHRLWLALALLGTATVVLFDRRIWPLLFLWVPLPVYMLSISYGGVPIFLPPWWPHSYYNVRYGIELLPAFAVFVALVAFWGMEFSRRSNTKWIALAGVAVLTTASYATALFQPPVSFSEGWVNSRTRFALDAELARQLRLLPEQSSILMYLGDHGAALQRAGIPIRRVIYEGNHRTWKQPTDPDGLWERALANPPKYADYVVAMERDPVDTGANKSGLTPLLIIHVLGQPQATIYQTRGR